MRKDSCFRRPLLSVLFFALLIGAAPSFGDIPAPRSGLVSVVAHHVSPAECARTGGHWVGNPNPNGKGSFQQRNPGNPNGYCQSNYDYCKEIESYFPGEGIAIGAGFGIHPWLGWGLLAIGALDVYSWYANDCYQH